MLHINVSLIHGNEAESMLMGAGDKYDERILMINQEMWWDKYKKGGQRALVVWWAAAK